MEVDQGNSLTIGQQVDQAASKPLPIVSHILGWPISTLMWSRPSYPAPDFGCSGALLVPAVLRKRGALALQEARCVLAYIFDCWLIVG